MWPGGGRRGAAGRVGAGRGRGRRRRGVSAARALSPEGPAASASRFFCSFGRVGIRSSPGPRPPPRVRVCCKESGGGLPARPGVGWLLCVSWQELRVYLSGISPKSWPFNGKAPPPPAQHPPLSKTANCRVGLHQRSCQHKELEEVTVPCPC